jgi:FkbM family methyltransferase
MGALAIAKRLSLSAGFYKQARGLQRIFSPSKRSSFREHRSLLSQFVRPGDLVFDVGANIGRKTEILLSLGARVVAFEPQPACCREISAWGNKRLAVVNKAVGANEGRAELYLTSTSALASLLPDWVNQTQSRGVRNITVPVTTLDKAIEEFGPPKFCKIDVEGFEVEVLRGLSHSIPAMSLEYHSGTRDVQAVNECMRVLTQRHGHEKYVINLTGQEDATFLSARWLSIQEFVDSFPGCTKGNAWGDILVCLSGAAVGGVPH